MSDWRYVKQCPPVPGWCQRPLQMANVKTGSWHLAVCGGANPDKCDYCAEMHRGDVAAVGRSGWTDRPDGTRAFWCTLTAPGASVLRWDTSQCHHSPDVRCAGDIGCQVDADDLALFHHRLPAMWTHFVTALRRILNSGLTGSPSSWPIVVEFFKTYEPQKRGALHVHFMLTVTGPVSERRFRAAFRLALRQQGFGSQFDCTPIDLSDSRNAARKAGYCAKYATKCAAELPDVRRIDPASGELHHGGLRSWSASWGWGETMASIKERRRSWAGGQMVRSAAARQPAPKAPLTRNKNTTQQGATLGPVVPSVAVLQPV